MPARLLDVGHVVRAADQAGRAPEERVGAGRVHHGVALALLDRAAAERDVAAELLGRQRLAGQRGLVDLRAAGGDPRQANDTLLLLRAPWQSALLGGAEARALLLPPALPASNRPKHAASLHGDEMTRGQYCQSTD